MKILIDGRVLKQKVMTGVQRYTKQLLEGFNRKGFHFDIAYPGENNRYFQHVWEHTVLPLRSGNYDLLFCPGNIGPVWKPRKVKMVVALHDIASLVFAESYAYSFRTYYRFAIPAIVKISDKIITGSDSEKRNIAGRFPADGHKVISIQNGIDRVFLNRHVSYSKDNYVLFVGSLNPRKNLKGVLQAFLKIAGRVPHKLLIAGPVEPIFRRDTYVNSDRIEFLDYIEDDVQLAGLYGKASLFIFPSFYEGSGLPPTEAMACGCPVLVSDIPALRERCFDAAVYCDPISVDDISEKMLKLLTDGQLRDNLINKGLDRAKQFSWDKTADETIRVFEEVLK
ncbi:MAG: glycosyltransferase family 1 protein [Elusimicrobiota bacterium]